MNTAASQQYAVEGQTFVLAPTSIIGQAAYDTFVDTEQKRELLKLGGGYARIYGPDGRSLATPLDPVQEGILYANIDYNEILGAEKRLRSRGALLEARRIPVPVQPEPP